VTVTYQPAIRTTLDHLVHVTSIPHKYQGVVNTGKISQDVMMRH